MTILSVYFSGTAFSVNSLMYTAGLLYLSSTDKHKIGFDGCGITDGMNGMLFGTGLEEQCETVVQEVHRLLNNNDKVTINCYGHSRGGIAALMLAKKLGGFAKDQVEMNLAVLDPVPGNLIFSANTDLFRLTLANQVMDLSECHNLNRVLAIYPYEPLPDLAFHAPIIPLYPKHTILEEDIIPGCHAGAEKSDGGLPYEIARTRVIEFMQNCGSSFNFSRYNLGEIAESTRTKKYLDLLEQSQNLINDSSRSCHSYRTKKIVVRKPYNESSWFLNDHHRKLKTNDFILDDIEKNPFLIDVALLSNLVADIQKSMSSESLATRKGRIIQAYFDTLQSNVDLSENDTIRSLRNIIALTLQRDRHSYSLFTTTTSGEALQALLELKKYQPIADLIMGSASGSVRYRDLRTFVIGANNSQYFHDSNKKQNLDLLEDHPMNANHKRF